MSYTFTQKILVIIAELADLNESTLSVRNALDRIAGHPRMYRHRIALENYLDNPKKKKKLYDKIYSLVRRKYIEKKVMKNKIGYFLTLKGEEMIFRVKIKDNKIKKLPRNQWIMIFYDVPEKEKRNRNMLRKYLHMLHFEFFQKSIWVTRYDVQKEIQDIIKRNKLKKFVKLLIVKKITE